MEYFSYMLNFHSVLAGPFFMFADYQDFIEGTHYAKRVLNTVPVVGNHLCNEKTDLAVTCAMYALQELLLIIIVMQPMLFLASSIKAQVTVFSWCSKRSLKCSNSKEFKTKYKMS